MGRPIVDITGYRFGKLVVKKLLERRSKASKPYWLCHCDCGKETEVLGNNLKQGLIQSCGCERTRKAAEAVRGTYYGNEFHDLTNRNFGRWHVVGYLGKVNGRMLWICECSCGTIRECDGQNLKRGMSRSCGCLQKEHAREAAFKHGLIDHPLYIVWISMKDRCNNPNNKAWRWYGQKGIKVCAEWHGDFQAFFDDASPTWKQGLWLDRKDSSLSYSKDNCHWVTPREQWEEAYESRQGYKFGSEETNVISEDIFAEDDE